MAREGTQFQNPIPKRIHAGAIRIGAHSHFCSMAPIAIFVDVYEMVVQSFFTANALTDIDILTAHIVNDVYSTEFSALANRGIDFAFDREWEISDHFTRSAAVPCRSGNNIPRLFP